MNFFTQSGKISINSESDSRRNLRKNTKFSKSQQIHIPIELVGYRSYDMEHLEDANKSQPSPAEEADPEPSSSSAIRPATSSEELSPQIEIQEEIERHDEEIPELSSMIAEEIETKLISFDEDHPPSPPLLDEEYEAEEETTFQDIPSETYLIQPEHRPHQIRPRIIHTNNNANGLTTSNAKMFSKNHTFIEILQSYLNFMFYIGLVPFRYQKVDSIKGTFRVYDNQFQWVFCAFVHALIICFSATKWTDPNCYVIFEKGHISKTDYLQFILLLCETAIVLSFIYILWSKNKHFKWLCEEYVVENEIKTIHSRYHQIKQKLQNLYILSTILICIFSILGLQMFLQEYLNAVKEDESLFDIENGYIVRQAKAYIFIDPDDERIGHSVNNYVVLIVSFAYVFSGFSYAIFFNMSYLFCLILTLILNDIGRYFIRQLNYGKLSMVQGLDLYEKIKKFMKIVNNGFELLIFIMVFSIIPYFGVSLSTLTNKLCPWSEKFTVVIIVANFCTILWFASQFPKQLKKLREWLGSQKTDERPDQILSFKVQMIQAELTEESVGLRCGFFIITYSIVGSVIHLLLIYAFISVGIRTGHYQSGPDNISAASNYGNNGTDEVLDLF